MPLTSTKYNEIVFQLLFSLDMGGSLEGDLIPFIMRELTVTRRVVREAYAHARAVFESKCTLDKSIAAASQAYEFERIGRVERNVLRLAFYELNRAELPRAMTFAEALRLTGKFSTKEATAFVNAVLEAHGAPLSPREEQATS